MPINVGYFTIRQPKLSSMNASTTKAPSSSGSLILHDCFSILYTGNASTCYFYNTGIKIITICDDNPDHPDNISQDILGLKVGELVAALNSTGKYQCTLITNEINNKPFLEFSNRQNIKNSFFVVKYNNQKDYLIDVSREGDLGNAKLNVKVDEISYQGELSKWVINDGKIYDYLDISVGIDGKANLGNDGVVITFEEAYDNATDLKKISTFTDIEIYNSTDQAMSDMIFLAAPLLVDDTLELFINQELAHPDKDYQIDYGEKPEITSTKFEPYIFNSNSVLKIRWNSDSVQQFSIPIGVYSAKDIANIINNSSNNFKAISYSDGSNLYLKIIGNRGTAYHQLRIEDGSANAIFGFENFQSKRGSGSGQINFMIYVPIESRTFESPSDTLTLNSIVTDLDNPFLGVYTDNFILKENNLIKTKEDDYVIDSSGIINFISEVKNESLLESVLKKDSGLFEPSYTLYRDDKPLVEGIDYIINPQGGWITLEKNPFPGEVFYVTYTNTILGKIDKEVVLGEPAKIITSKSETFSIDSNSNILKLYVDDLEEQTFILDINLSSSANSIANKINLTANGFKCYLCNKNLEFITNKVGPKSIIRVGLGSANIALGLVDNQSAMGIGAIGDEKSLQVKNPPMDIIGFTAPEGGDTIIIKNNDVTDRYKANSLIKLVDDFYQIKSSYLENRANIISSMPGPYTIILDTNDNFNFTIDGEYFSVTFSEGIDIDIFSIVKSINLAKPNSAKVLYLNGSNRIQLLGVDNISIGDGNANRTLGFDKNDFDISTPDTVISILGNFRNTYIAPDTYTSTDPINFITEYSTKMESSQGSSTIKIEGDLSNIYVKNIFIKINSNFLYKVSSSSYSDGYTEVVLNSIVDVPIFHDTLLEYSSKPIYEEGETDLKSKNFIYLEKPYSLIVNGVTLSPETDYTISESGDISLSKGISTSDSIIFNYYARRFLDSSTSIDMSYSYFGYLKKGSNIKYSAQIINPDNFYLNVLHGSTILTRVINEINSKLQYNLSSGSSTGFPTGETTTTENDSEGVTTYKYTIGDFNDKIQVSENVFNFYDRRIKFFEDERMSINGYLVGAENGWVTLTQILDSATKTPPQRLFPTNDSRPAEEVNFPYRVPALDGLNQNDSGNSSNGTSSSYLNLDLSKEIYYLNLEKTKLNSLKSKSISLGTLTSSGNFSSISGGEEIELYVEVSNGGILQANVTVSMPPPVTTPPVPPNINPTVTPVTATQVANAINQAVNNAFGISVNLCSVSGSQVVLTANSSSYCRCCYIVRDNSKINFGLYNEASVRSRNTTYTAGSSYSYSVPGSSSVHIDINNQNDYRTKIISLMNNQISDIEGQMEEWVSDFRQAFLEAQTEKPKANLSLDEAEYSKSYSESFSDLKYSNIFNSIDSSSVIDSRISFIDSRISQINRRITELASRVSQVSSSLTREALYDPRYSWVSVLADRVNGYYAARDREISQESKRQKEIANGMLILSSLNKIF